MQCIILTGPCTLRSAVGIVDVVVAIVVAIVVLVVVLEVEHAQCNVGACM
jgi:hypothetical protein